MTGEEEEEKEAPKPAPEPPPQESPLVARKNRAKQNLKALVEHARGTISSTVFPKDQIQFMDPLDKVSSMILQESREAETIQKTVRLMKDAARRVLRAVPSKMTRILNELDGLEQETNEFAKILARVPRH